MGDAPSQLRKILHVDMDAFYASVEERDRPELVGKPVIVGGTPEGRGVVAAANYVARKFGVHSAMPAVTAHRMCPHAVVLTPRIDHYAGIARQIREILYRYTPLIEPLSLDEAFLDVTGSQQLFGTAPEIGQMIKQEIQQELDLVASVGVAPNKFLAKIASDLEKPDGFVVVDPDQVNQFLDPLPVRRIWGVGRQGSKLFDRLGISTIGQLRRLPPSKLRRHLGSHGEQLWRLAHGTDDRPVVPDRNARSVSHETTFASDINNPESLRSWLQELTDQVARRLRRNGLRGRTVQIKVRFGDFRTITRDDTLREPTNSTDELWHVANALLAEALRNEPRAIRLLGVGVSGIDRSEMKQRRLFDGEARGKQTRLDAVVDDVQDTFGRHAVERASGLLRRTRDESQP